MKKAIYCIACSMMLGGAACLAAAPVPPPHVPKAVVAPAPAPQPPKHRDDKPTGTLAKADAFERFQPIPLPAGQPLYLTVCKEHLLRLPLAENGTTGYLWSVESSNPKVVELKASTFLPPPRDNGMVGVGGVRVFTFKTRTTGTATLTFRHERPWEKEPDAPCYQVVVLVVEED